MVTWIHVDHAAAATRANVETLTGEQRAAFAIVFGFGARLGIGNGEGGADESELLKATGVGEEAEVANATKALG